MTERIKMIMDSQNLTQQNFADMLDISPASLSSIFNQRTKPTMNHVEAIHKRFPNINLQWLMFGEGSMYTKNQNSIASSTPPAGQQMVAFDDKPQQMDLFGGLAAEVQNGTKNMSLTQGQGQQSSVQAIKIVDKPQRRISEIRIFFDDQTWETFVAKK